MQANVEKTGRLGVILGAFATAAISSAACGAASNGGSSPDTAIAPVANDPGIEMPVDATPSPDGHEIYFIASSRTADEDNIGFVRQAAIYKVSAAGGPITRLHRGSPYITGRKDGKAGLFRSGLAGGACRQSRLATPSSIPAVLRWLAMDCEFKDVIADFTASAGLHRARNADVFASADSHANRTHGLRAQDAMKSSRGSRTMKLRKYTTRTLAFLAAMGAVRDRKRIEPSRGFGHRVRPRCRQNRRLGLGQRRRPRQAHASRTRSRTRSSCRRPTSRVSTPPISARPSAVARSSSRSSPAAIRPTGSRCLAVIASEDSRRTSSPDRDRRAARQRMGHGCDEHGPGSARHVRPSGARAPQATEHRPCHSGIQDPALEWAEITGGLDAGLRDEWSGGVLDHGGPFQRSDARSDA